MKSIAIFIVLSIIMPARAQNIDIDLNKIPFSHPGSWFALSTRTYYDQDAEPGLYIHDLNGRRLWNRDGVFRIEALKNGKKAQATYTANPEMIQMQVDRERVEIIYQDANTLRMQGHGLGVRLALTAYDQSTHLMPIKKNQWIFHMGGYPHYVVTVMQGQTGMDGTLVPLGLTNRGSPYMTLEILPADGFCSVMIENFYSGWEPADPEYPFGECRQDVVNSYMDWLKAMPEAPEKYREPWEYAAFINRSSIVDPRGLIKRKTMLMSKNWMHAVWSWDHCYNAMALSYKLPGLSWDQFMVLFDEQEPSGALPDHYTDYDASFGYVKPPIHGWALLKMLEKEDYATQERMEEIYEPLIAWTDYWFKYRDTDGNGLPEYFYGNDSGWDNATPFDAGCPVEGPDLAAYLVIQMEAIAEVAERIGFYVEADLWAESAMRLQKKLIDELWDGEKFIIRKTDGVTVKESNSLMRFLPLVLGDRLPSDIRETMVEDLWTSGIVTDHGPATEHPESPLYQADGYWRGPIWAPTTMIIVDGLNACGETEKAEEAARRFCDMCLENGFGENFNALTGESLRDPAYTWTASVFLILAHEYLR